MGAGDRGGMAALNRMSPRVDWSQLGRMIKKTRNPIMCICNDSGSQKALLLVFFVPPTEGTITGAGALCLIATGKSSGSTATT